jgi:outer membrane protein assembly factor BamB
MNQRCSNHFWQVAEFARIQPAHASVEFLRIQLLSILLALAAMPAAAEDWPVVRGDTLGTGVAKSAVPENPEVLWTYRAKQDAGFDATAVIVDGIIYVGDSAGTFHAVRLADGKPVWTKEFPDSGFAAGAAVEKDHLYVGDLEGNVRCLAIADGAERWTMKMDAEVYAGPTTHGDDVLVTSESGTLICLDAASGKERWPAFRIDSPLRCSPTIAGERVMLAGCDSLLHVINVADGKETHTVEIDGPTGSTPAIHGERVYFGTEGGTFFAIDVPADAEKEPAVAWSYRDKKHGQPIRSAAAVTDRIIVYGSQGKAICGLDPATHEPKWQVATRSRVESSPVISGNRAIAATTAGKIYLLNVDTGEATWEYEAGGGFTASPAVVDGRIVIGNTDGTLYCFGKISPTEKEIATGDTESKED